MINNAMPLIRELDRKLVSTLPATRHRAQQALSVHDTGITDPELQVSSGQRPFIGPMAAQHLPA